MRARLLFTGLVAALFVSSVAKADWNGFVAFHHVCWPKGQKYNIRTYTCDGQRAMNLYNQMKDDPRFRSYNIPNANGVLYQYQATSMYGTSVSDGVVTSCSR